MINNDFWARNEASDGILLRETVKKYVLSIFRGILLFGMCFLILQPILNKISVSFMAEKDLYDTTIVVLPKNFSVLNYKVASTIMDYKTSLFNSLWVSTGLPFGWLYGWRQWGRKLQGVRLGCARNGSSCLCRRGWWSSKAASLPA